MELYIFSGVCILAILFIIVLIMCIVNHRQLKELNEYAEDGDLAETLKVYYKKINDLKVMIHNASDKSLESRIALCEDRLNFTFSKFNIVNFDAFDDISGKLSFALALLDSTDSGIIITSLYGHSSCNTYIRYVVSGTTAIKLIDEEKQALNGAINGERVSSIAE